MDIFKQNLIAAARALARDPRLPILSLALALLSLLPELLSNGAPGAGVSFLLLPVAAFMVGYVGAERLWYLRLFRDREMTLAEVWSSSWRFFGRYLVLSLLAFLIFLPLVVPLVMEAVEIAGELAEESRRTGEPSDPEAFEKSFYTPTFLLLSFGLSLLIDFLLTFTTPALAFSTKSVWGAVKENIRLIRTAAPVSLFYVLIPPLALLLTLRFIPPSQLGSGVWLTLTMLGVFLNLLFKGATAAFYLRQHPDVPDTGAVDA